MLFMYIPSSGSLHLIYHEEYAQILAEQYRQSRILFWAELAPMEVA